jgi:hypothetical protein
VSPRPGVPKADPVERTDSISGIDPTKVSVRTLYSEQDRIIPWQVTTHPDWQPYWSSEQLAGLRRSMGYYFVYKENVVEHFNELERDEVRLSTSGWVTDGAGRVMNPDRQLLMLCPKHLWDKRLAEKGERAKQELVQAVVGNPEGDQPHLLKNAPAALEEVRKGSYLTGDTDEVG